MLKKLLVSAVFLFSGVASWGQIGERTHPTMDKALVMFERLLAFGATPLTNGFVESVTGAKLTPPDTDYPPEVLKMLADMGHPPPGKPGYVVGYAEINPEVRVKAHFADPTLSLSFAAVVTDIPFPPVLTEETLNAYTKKSIAAQEVIIRKHCIKMGVILASLRRNGWVMYEHPLAGDEKLEDGNFFFQRINDHSTVTMDEGCLAALMIGTVLKK